jgi:hypothetical protein
MKVYSGKKVEKAITRLMQSSAGSSFYKKILLLVIGAIFIIFLFLFLFIPTDVVQEYEESYYPSPNVLFLSQIPQDTDIEYISSRLALWDWDLIVVPESNLGKQDKEILSELADQVTYISKDSAEANLIVFEELGVLAFSSGVSDDKCNEMVDNLKAVISKSDFSDLSFISLTDSDLNNETDGCVEELKAVLQEHMSKGDIIVSPGEQMLNDFLGDVRLVTDNIHYINVGKVDDSLISPLRIVSRKGEVLVNKLAFPRARNQTNTDEEIPTYKIEVAPDALKEVYNRMTTYDFTNSDWRSKYENPDDIHVAIPGKLWFGDQVYEIELSTRGNIGNNWEGIKKSWTVDFVGDKLLDGRDQIKFVIPSDRGYTEQIFIQEINDYLGVLTPKVQVAGLKINDIDFGPYILYEDFDKVFIEKREYGSDTAIGSSKFMDRFMSYSVWHDLNNFEKTGNAEDKSDEARILLKYHEDYSLYFSRDNTQRWIASQLFTGDRHQNSSDNLRFFVDKSTGRIIIISWDQTLAKISQKSSFYDIDYFQNKVLSNKEDREAIERLLVDLVNKDERWRSRLADLDSRYRDIFLNDSMRQVTKAQIDRRFETLYEIYEENLNITKETLNED